MTRQGKVYVIPREHVLALLRGEGRIRLPFDAEIVGYAPGCGESLGVLVHSPSFPVTQAGAQYPLVVATMERHS